MRRKELRANTTLYFQPEQMLPRRKVQRLIFTSTDGENNLAIDENLVSATAPKKSCIPQK